MNKIFNAQTEKHPRGLYLASDEAVEEYMANTDRELRYWVETDFGWFGGLK